MPKILEDSEFSCDGHTFKVSKDYRPLWYNRTHGEWIPVNRRMPQYDNFVKGLIKYLEHALAVVDDNTDNCLVCGAFYDPDDGQYCQPCDHFVCPDCIVKEDGVEICKDCFCGKSSRK